MDAPDPPRTSSRRSLSQPDHELYGWLLLSKLLSNERHDPDKPARATKSAHSTDAHARGAVAVDRLRRDRVWQQETTGHDFGGLLARAVHASPCPACSLWSRPLCTPDRGLDMLATILRVDALNRLSRLASSSLTPIYHGLLTTVLAVSSTPLIRATQSHSHTLCSP